ncbi:MAG: ferredoxin:glutaredoxin reductase [Anaerolineae bacterium]|nr:ferredoxin:glutaredoxin reductase [Anaerolineae bacterium]
MSQARDLYERLKQEGEASGYFLNSDLELVLDLMDGLLINQERYGYWACPCRLADGIREKDLDIICPCDYRDADLDDYGTCYCALYVSQEIAQGRAQAEPIPDRRGETAETHDELVGFTTSGIPIWRCKVCGYLCARPRPPLKCPICKADQDRFEKFG